MSRPRQWRTRPSTPLGLNGTGLRVPIALILLLSCAAPQRGSDTPALWLGGDVHFGARGGEALSELALDAPLVVNLEGPLSLDASTSTSEHLRNPPDSALRLKQAHVIAVGVDNNHANDEGAEGRARTEHALTQLGLAPLGQASLQLGGVSVTVLQLDLSGAHADVTSRVRAACTLPGPCVVLFHVLAPPLYLPEPATQQAVSAAIEAGANAVLVHGSHAVGAVERRGDAVIAWGLGNVAFDCDCTQEDEGLLVRLTFAAERVERATVTPIRAGLHGARAQRSPEATTDLELLESLGSKLHRKSAHDADW